MQKLTRSLAMAGVLAFAGLLAGCGDDVTVPDTLAVTVTPPTASIAVGASVTLTASVTGTNSNKNVTWTTSDASKATVDANGKVTGVAVGSATVTATAAADANVKSSALITVTTVNKGVRQVTISPPNAIIKVGEFIQLTPQVDRDPGVAGTVTWSIAPATGIATIDQTGKVTAVANGSAVVTAASTVDPTVTGTMALTVRPLQPAQISIQKITTGTLQTPVNVNAVVGQIEVTLNLDPGDQTVTKVEVLIDGAVACFQNLSVKDSEALSLAAVFPEDVQAVDVVCPINTAAFNATTGVPTYLNGVRALTARATIGGTTPGNIATPSTALTFANANTYLATFGAFTASAIGTSGYSVGLGFRTGPVTVSVLPVIYNAGQTLAAGSTVSFGSPACDASGNAQRARALVAPAAGSSSWTATFPTSTSGGTIPIAQTVVNYEFNPSLPSALPGAPLCGVAFPNGEAVTINAVDNNGNSIFNVAPPAGANAVRLDNRAPGTPTFVANPNNRQNGWINATVGLTGQNGTSGGTISATDNDWLRNGTADAGVGGGTNTATSYLRFLRVADATGGLVDAARGATASSTPTLAAPSVAKDTYCALATARDELGNESALPAAGATCNIAPLATVFDLLANAVANPNALRFGVDIAPPTVAYDVTSLTDGARQTGASIGGNFIATLADTGAVGNSGMLAGSPLVANVIRREADGTSFTTPAAPGDCVVGSLNTAQTVCNQSTTGLLAPALPLVSTNIAGLTTAGYYTYTSTALDAAGNSTAIANAAVIVYDNTPATATPPSVPATITGSFSSASFLNDNLSIRDYYYTVGFGGVPAYITPTTFRIAANPTVVDAFNAATLSNTNVGINTTINTFLGLQSTTGATPNAYAAGSIPMNSLNLFVRDQAQAAYSGPASTVVAPTAPAAGVSITNFTSFAPATSNATICANTLAGGCGATPTSTVVTAVATGTTAVFNNPFGRVDFYAPRGGDLILIGSVPAASATLVDNGATRVWTYSLTFQAATLYPQLGGVSPAVVGPVNIYAFGINAAGNVALVAQPVAQTINP